MLWKGIRGAGFDFPSAEQLADMANNGTAKVVGVGSYGIVYKYQGDDKTYAVKVVFNSSEESELMRNSVVKELAVLKAVIGAPNTVQVQGITADDSHTFLIMDYYPHSLSQAIRANAYSVDRDFPHHFSELMRGLRGLHARGVVHNDIKPGNILLMGDSGSSELCYADFGLSAVLSCVGPANQHRVGNTTHSFSAPEEDALQRVSKQSDVFSLAITIACYLAQVQSMVADPIQLLADVNGYSLDTATEYLLFKSYARFPKQITIEYLMARIMEHERANASGAPGRAMELLRANPDIHQFLNRMLLADPAQRPSMEDQQWGIVDPVPTVATRSGDFYRCFPGETHAEALGILGDSINRFSGSRKNGVPYALTMDLAGRFSVTCDHQCDIETFLLLCFFIVEKVHFSREHSVDDLITLANIEDTQEDRDYLVRLELVIISNSDFNIVSCQLDAIRAEFSQLSLRETMDRFAQELSSRQQ